MSLSAVLRVERGSFVLDLALGAAAGEVVAVLGPNAAGKTTLLRTLAGLLPLTSGSVTLAGRVLEDRGVRVPTSERAVGVVFQDLRLFPHLSARDNIAFGPRSTGVGTRAARAAAEQWLDRMGLGGLGALRPHQLSGGQAQRVALARALAADPALLLLDEPLSALDAGTRGEVRAELRQVLAGFTGGPALLVTHDPLDAMTLADRLVILEDGGIVQDGPPALVAARPATSYVAQLMGLTLLRGEAVDGVVELADGTRVVTAQRTVRGPTLVVIRPSSVLISAGIPAESSARNVWQRRIASLEVLGDRVRVSFAGVPALHADVTTAAVLALRLAPGDLVWVSVKATDVQTYPDPRAVGGDLVSGGG